MANPSPLPTTPPSPRSTDASADERLIAELRTIVGDANCLSRPGELFAYECDGLTLSPRRPRAVVLPASTAEVVAIVRTCRELGVPFVPRGAGTGLSGGAHAPEEGILIECSRMNRILEVDAENRVAVVQPGVVNAELSTAIASLGLFYAPDPSSQQACTIGGNVATNAGGMRAVKYGVTRHHVLGLEAVLPSGEVIQSGGKFVKASTGYDLTQLIIGSEGTLALVTEITVRLYPRPAHKATILAPFATLEQVTAAVPKIVQSGLAPLMLEYIDLMTMAAATAYVGLELGLPEEIKANALAYLLVVLEHNDTDRLDEDTAAVATLVGELGAMDTFVLPPNAGAQLVDAREKAFWVAKANNANEIVDVVVPRASIPEFLEDVSKLAAETGTWIAGCGHAGDGNVHLSVFQADPEVREKVMHDLFAAGMALGGAISGEHGLGKQKTKHFLALEDPAKVALMRRIKAAFDPHGILNPGTIFDGEATH